jgi:hypothetical protein
MGKIAILSLILLTVVILTGCATTYVCPDGSRVKDPTECKQYQEQGKVTVEIEKPAVEDADDAAEETNGKTYVTVVEKNVEPEFQDFVDKVYTYDNYQYRYTGPNSAYSMEVSVKGNRMGYYFKDYALKYGIDEFYDHVMLDMSQETAYQYCESKSKCSDENREFARQVDYSDRKIPTLIDVMDSIVTAKIVADEMMMQKSSKKVEYTDKDGITGVMWVDKYFGTPLRKEYKIGDKQKVEIFDAFSKDGVTEGMVTAPASLRAV